MNGYLVSNNLKSAIYLQMDVPELLSMPIICLRYLLQITGLLICGNVASYHRSRSLVLKP